MKVSHLKISWVELSSTGVWRSGIKLQRWWWQAEAPLILNSCTFNYKKQLCIKLQRWWWQAVAPLILNSCTFNYKKQLCIKLQRWWWQAVAPLILNSCTFKCIKYKYNIKYNKYKINIKYMKSLKCKNLQSES